MTLSVFIVGGGASGTLLAIRLLQGSPSVQVTLVEQSGRLGRGLAYATGDDQHVLNVVPGKMSAFADDPEHFSRWLVAEGKLAPDDPFAFVPRRYFGDYLDSTLRMLAARTGRLQLLHGRVTRLRPGRHSTTVAFESGDTAIADIVVLATGHDTAYVPTALPAGGGDLPVLIVGSGLSMVDTWLSLADSRRRVVAMSRRGLLPASHGEGPPPAVDAGDLPFGTTVTQFLRWFRRFARRAEAGDWRSAVDALRPHTQRLWSSWSIDSRRRFLRHVKPWWDVHRHRLPASLHEKLHESLATGALDVVAGTPLNFHRGAGPQLVRFRRRGSAVIDTIAFGAVYDCRGLVRDWRDRPGSLVSQLIADGHARIDGLGLGLEVTADNGIVTEDGRAQPGLFAIGPLTRGKWFEIEAVPDIRAQCDRLAAHLDAMVFGQGASLPEDRRLSRAAS